MPARSHYHQKLGATDWMPRQQVVLPQPEEVHLWRIRLQAPPEQLQVDREMLAADEQARADKFHYLHDRNEFIIARATLRRLLGNYLDMPPASLVFQYSEYGKPELALDSQLQFNLSHAGSFALIGFTSDRAIGVDLEPVDNLIELARLTSRFFSPAEAQQVLQLPVAEQPPAFFRTWTRKEAFIKAHGQGLRLPLDQFAVTVALDAPLKIEQIDWAPETVDR
ncbi:MAG: 4'-phosphopantetheinyl transferase superfamily protein, partial [Bacteroidota bacterium]